MKAYDLKDNEIENRIGQLVSDCGYASVKACLNDCAWWDQEIDWIETQLKEQLKQIESGCQ